MGSSSKRCTTAGVPFIDLATDVDDQHGPLAYGGRVLWSGEDARCPFCMDLLDQDAMRRDSLPDRAERGIVRQSIDPPNQGCPYCSGARRRRAD